MIVEASSEFAEAPRSLSENLIWLGYVVFNALKSTFVFCIFHACRIDV